MHICILFYPYYQYFIRVNALNVMVLVAFTSYVLLLYTNLSEKSSDELILYNSTRKPTLNKGLFYLVGIGVSCTS